MRRRRYVTIAVAVVALGWVVAVAAILLGAARHLDDARDRAARAADQLDDATLLTGRAADPLARASADFRAAHRGLRNPVLAPLRLLPVVGRQVRALDALSGAAATVADVAADTLRRSAAAADDKALDGPARLRLVDELSTTVGRARDRIARLDLGPSRALVDPVAEAHNDLADRVIDARRSLDDAAQALTAVRALLAGPSRYLVVAAHNSEMRGGSGMWLVGGVLTAQDGRLDLGRTEYLYDVAAPREDVQIGDADVQAQWGWMHPEREWRSLMGSPRLPASASLAQRMWQAAGQPPVDGVLVVDAVGLSDLVAATGPVTIDNRRYDKASILRELLHDQYLRQPSRRARREALSDVTTAVFDALDEGRWNTTDLVRELASAVRGRHLMAWSSDPVEQQGWAAAALSGQLADDSLVVSLLNRGGNKLDWFTRMRASLATRPDGDGTLVTVTMTIGNQAPAGEPSYVVGPHPEAGTVAGEYKGVVALNVPGAAQDVTLDGVPAPLGGADGPTAVIAGELRIQAGATATVTASFRLPGRHGSLEIEPSARYPGIRWRYQAAQWVDVRSHRVAW